MKIMLAALVAISTVCFGQMTLVRGDIDFQDPFDPDDYIYASIRVSESGNWNNVLAWGYTDAASNWKYETDKWRMALCDYVDVTCALMPRQGTTGPIRWETWVSVEQEPPIFINFLFAPTDCGQNFSGENDFTPLGNSTWASIKEAF